MKVQIFSEQTGLITYMRTDGITIANDAIGNIRNTISSVYETISYPKNLEFINQKLKMPKRLTKQFVQQIFQ